MRLHFFYRDTYVDHVLISFYHPRSNSSFSDGEVKMIPGFSGTVLDESQIYHQISFDQPLMANPWSSDKEVYVWKTDISQSFGR